MCGLDFVSVKVVDKWINLMTAFLIVSQGVMRKVILYTTIRCVKYKTVAAYIQQDGVQIFKGSPSSSEILNTPEHIKIGINA